jgi:hypothetical protein
MALTGRTAAQCTVRHRRGCRGEEEGQEGRGGGAGGERRRGRRGEEEGQEGRGGGAGGERASTFPYLGGSTPGGTHSASFLIAPPVQEYHMLAMPVGPSLKPNTYHKCISSLSVPV